MSINELRLAIINKKQEIEDTKEKFYSIIELAIQTVPSLKGVSIEEQWDTLEEHPATKFFAEEIVKLCNQCGALSESLETFKKYKV